MNKQSILIIGAKSDIAKSVAEKYAQENYTILLGCRNTVELESFVEHLSLRYETEVSLHEHDVSQLKSCETFIDKLPILPDVVVCSIGFLGDQEQAQNDVDHRVLITNVNYTFPMCFLSSMANRFAERGDGCIIGISSVAGDRGRKSNYFYGAAKAGFSAFLSGLRNRLSSEGVHVMTVNPGFVNTQMTAGMDLPDILTAQPEQVAKAIYDGQMKKRNVIYTLWMWRWIMLIIKHIPEVIFKKLSL